MTPSPVASTTTPVPAPVPAPTTVLVPVSNPAHPSHRDWLAIIMKSLELAATIGPAIVSITDPQDAALASGLGRVTMAGIAGLSA